MSNKVKGQKSRDRILEVALNLFAQQGYDQTSVQEIANLCGVSQTTVFYHFKNKKLLFEHVLQYVIANNRNQFYERSKNIDKPLDLLLTLLRSNVEWAYHNPEEAQVLILLFYFATNDQNFKSLATKSIDGGRQMVLELLQKIDKMKGVKTNLSLNQLSIIIQQYINAVMFNILVREDKEKTLSDFQNNVNSFIHNLI